MKVEIANPVYDTVFKFMMEDNTVAKLLISSIIGEKIITLDIKPQEHMVDKLEATDKRPSITVYRLDFSAKIETPDGYKMVIIEMQKASYPSDISRFRGYLGNQYANKNNVILDENKKLVAMRIYSIYFLGKDLEICDTPVLSVFPEIRDVATGEIVEKRSSFIEALNHKCWVVQISCLKKRRRTDLELLLSVFDQSNLSSNDHILNVSEDDFPEEYRHLIRRLRVAAADVELKEQMLVEDIYLDYVKSVERMNISKGIEEGRKKGIEEGRKEEKKEIAHNLLRKGMSVSDISNVTGLSEQKIEELKNEQI